MESIAFVRYLVPKKINFASFLKCSLYNDDRVHQELHHRMFYYYKFLPEKSLLGSERPRAHYIRTCSVKEQILFKFSLLLRINKTGRHKVEYFPYLLPQHPAHPFNHFS